MNFTSLRKTVGKSVTDSGYALRHAVILISNDRTSASKKMNRMALIRTLTVSTTAFERTKEKFYGIRQTVTVPFQIKDGSACIVFSFFRKGVLFIEFCAILYWDGAVVLYYGFGKSH